MCLWKNWTKIPKIVPEVVLQKKKMFARETKKIVTKRKFPRFADDWFFNIFLVGLKYFSYFFCYAKNIIFKKKLLASKNCKDCLFQPIFSKYLFFLSFCLLMKLNLEQKLHRFSEEICIKKEKKIFLNNYLYPLSVC